MAWAGSTRRSRLPRDWPRIRRRIIRRDSGVCTWLMSDGRRCDQSGTDVDHIVPGDDHRDENLRLLCTWHHGRKSGTEGGSASAAKRVSTTRPKLTHPALED
jgi:5-methylcytosine-specific restriction endonuclease McrA